MRLGFEDGLACALGDTEWDKFTMDGTGRHVTASDRGSQVTAAGLRHGKRFRGAGLTQCPRTDVCLGSALWQL